MSTTNILALFHPVVAEWFRQQYGEPSPPQVRGWPVIAAGEHTLIFSPTGSGKTLAAFLWCIDDIFRLGLNQPEKTFQKNSGGVHTLYVSPLKALNNDIQRNLQLPIRGISRQAEEAGIKMPLIRTIVRTGDTPGTIRRSMVQTPPHILITTPESLYLLLTSPRGREIFRQVRFLIIDEIHALSNNKRGVHLSLSLERMVSLNQTEPVRIGLSATQRPLQRIAAFLGGQRFDSRTATFQSRTVNIVECPPDKKLTLQVRSPVDDFSDLPQSTVWPAVIQTLYDLIRQHRTTLIFANMRAQAEKIARLLNDLHHQSMSDPQVNLAMPHHGSMSREMRFEVESRLKQGKLAAVVATGSLELGIDIGSIDLVIQLEAPKSISASLQRIGRSGHILDQISTGIIVPLYPSDLDDAAALSAGVTRGNIEETIIPENCLDVLAQQILAEVAMRKWQRLELFALFRQSYCYRHLTPAAFNAVLDMLAGQYADKKLPVLQPRLTWDKINDRLIARPGARLLAILNGGTIPDRGYYTVILADGNARLGEMEEEFVFESRIGDTFYLGNHEWRIENIQRDRIVVTPVKAIRPRPPFWKGEIPARDYETALQVGIFRQWMIDNLADPQLVDHLNSTYHLDQKSAKNLIDYLNRQKAHTQVLPTHSHIVVEWFHDSVGDLNVMIHAPFGGRVNACWALALTAVLRQQHQTEIQWSYNDDGILMRLIDTADLPDLEPLLRLTVPEITRWLHQALQESPLFAIQFRYNAGRALLLERSRPGKRIPLWLQRLRAADLLQVVRDQKDFPIILETLRSCLEDIFDLPALFGIINKIGNREIQIHTVHTPYPSPMASGLLFNFLANQMYEHDRVRVSGEVSLVSSDLLAEVLNSGSIPALVSSDIISTALKRWQHLSDTTRARTAEDLFLIIEKLGPIGTDDLQLRARDDISPWLQELTNENRISLASLSREGWICNSDRDNFNPPWTDDKIRFHLRRYLSTQGPVTTQVLSAQLTFDPERVEHLLELMRQDRDVVCGKLVQGSSADYWCARDNFAYLYRQAVISRRRASVAADRNHYFKFLLHWHGFTNQVLSAGKLIEHYRGIPFPLYFLEREILSGRLVDVSAEALITRMTELRQLISEGNVQVRLGTHQGVRAMLIYLLRAEGNLFSYPHLNSQTDDTTVHDSRTIFNFLKENGASYFADLEYVSGIPRPRLILQLQDLLLKGLVSCDDYDSLLAVLNYTSRTSEQEFSPPVTGNFVSHSRKPAIRRGDVRQRIIRQVQLNKGRWFLTSSFAAAGRPVPAEQKVEMQTRLLLQRHGILVKEYYRWENGFEPWYNIFQMLKKLEWRGEILRGYFIEGLSGIQYALPGAITVLENITLTDPGIRPVAMLSTGDPALPFGRNIDWNLTDRNKNKIAIIRGAGNHLIFVYGLPVVYSENYASRLTFLDGFVPDTLLLVIQQFKRWFILPSDLRPRKKLEIELIDNREATVSEFAGEFIRYGFEKGDKKLILWPSRVQ